MKKLNALLVLVALVTFSFTAPRATENYTVNSNESKITWVGKKVTGEHTGTIDLKEGGFTFEDEKLTGGSFVIDMTTIGATDLTGDYKDKLDGHLKSDDFFGVATYPTATLVITDVKANGNGAYQVSGDITIKKTTQKITFPANVAVSGNQITATANLTIDRSKFDVRYGSGSFFENLGDKAIYDDFTLDISLVASK